jgi:hypothetical protein
MNARLAMIFNGNIATQLNAGPADGIVKAVEPYEDKAGDHGFTWFGQNTHDLSALA